MTAEVGLGASRSTRARLLALTREPLPWLIVLLPAAVILHWKHAAPVWVFLTACGAIIPLAGLMGRATESLAETMGPTLGGLLNATFGNAAELIIALAALRRGPEMYPLIKASITGSIIGNVLLVLGVALLMAGFRYKIVHFNRTAAGVGSTLLAIAAIALLFPSVFGLVHPAGAPVADRNADPAAHAAPAIDAAATHLLSEEIAVVLAFLYLLSLLFTLHTHRHLIPFEKNEGEAHSEPEWGRGMALTVLLIATAGVAWMSEILIGSVAQASDALGLNEIFAGVIVVAIIGNAAEHSTAVLVAMKNKLDLAVGIAIGSSLQIALFVAPVLVFSSMFINPEQPLDLSFTTMEWIAMLVSVAVLALVCHDGESHWLEGAMLLGLYLIIALGFYNLPVTH